MKLSHLLPTWATWGLAFPLIVLNGWVLLVIFQYFNSLITIFITANLLAFILNYVVQFLVTHRVNRNRAIVAVFIFTFLSVISNGVGPTTCSLDQSPTQVLPILPVLLGISGSMRAILRSVSGYFSLILADNVVPLYPA